MIQKHFELKYSFFFVVLALCEMALAGVKFEAQDYGDDAITIQPISNAQLLVNIWAAENFYLTIIFFKFKV